MPVRNKAAMATASATAVLVLLVPLLTGGVRAQTAPATVQESGNVALVAEETVQLESSVPQTSVTDDMPPLAPPGSVTLGMLEDVQQKNLLLAAKVQTAQLQRQLEEAGSDAQAVVTPASSAAGLASSAPGTGQPDNLVAPRIKDAGAARPQVLEISGKGSALYAVLQMPDGSRPEVTRGSRVTIGKATLTVSRVSLSGITLSDGSALPF
ncbi:type IV pilus biogenesis protein PilP [Salmonella enterica subsp. enterica serovar Poona]|uniref:Type IV pilus biogenesis protein PilP n=2 Tax=Salmonella enterica TaxID=28901 RepID=A0A5T2WJZ8_SALER|nr:type IV pilus biogenesis protein PilP [Salmonella enterica]EBS2925873.1 type IV pilus biogenesis protein PilP [Salmonella enterica subsp. enterica serovar Hvittingfoss]ECE9635894.1 type IV pilus biogenesis protein PilP [Salmonella enterica subsp. enterica serovar Muenchen]ECW9808908.1 type IV pilus biogenesis protein PilP [Salmonella enterica subsp. enterica serovar Poona]ECY5335794.1 type IV pilus biogenesis protein PilP [Salmonella enterica subsp. enterica serovar Stanley]EDW2060267.1 typ